MKRTRALAGAVAFAAGLAGFSADASAAVVDTVQAAQEMKKSYEETMANIETERQQKLDSTRLAASKEYDEIIANAREKAGKIISDAKIEAQKEAEAKQHEMQEQMALLVAQAAYKIAASRDSSENDSKLYDTFLSDAEKKG